MSQSIRSTQGNVEERFSHILQPIRDLAKNWDVDIAHFLEEYLEELQKIEITFDDGITTMNFSEAALLIQGSAGVYAKKVEYFHALVYQVLDLVTQKKKPSNHGGENQTEAENSLDAADDNQYLALDDIPESNGYFVKEQDLSLNKNVRPIPEMPTRLIPLEEAEKGDNCLFNKKGEVMGNHCDFNIDTGFITVDGSILLEMGDRALINMITMQQETLRAIVEEEFSHRQDDIMAMSGADEMNSNVENVEPVNDLPQFADATQPNLQDNNNINEAAPKRMLRKRVEFTKPPSSTKSTIELWTPLDPHEKSKALEKILVKKKPFKIPPGLEDKLTKKRKKKSVIKTESHPLFEVVEKLFSHRPKFPKSPQKVTEFPEFEVAYWEEHKLREAYRREEKKQMKREEQEELETIEAEETRQNNEDEPLIDALGADDDEEIFPLQLNADLFSKSQELRLPDGLVQESSSSLSDDITMSYEDLVQRHVERFLASAAEYAQITELSRRVSEWEGKIQPKLKEEESHEPFDIHKYGTFIIEQLVRGVRKSFKELVGGKQDYEICRYALATLQLANVYNVELTIIPDKPGNIMDCLYVTLLSTKRHFEDLEDYRAPSLNT